MLFSASGIGLGGPGGQGGPAGAGNPAGVGNVAGAGNPAGIGNVAGAGNPAGAGNVGGIVGDRININALLNPPVGSPNPQPRAGSSTIPWGSSGLDTFVSINDAEGLGVRGYVPNGINQPYGKRIAEALEHHKNNSTNCPYNIPNMDGNAERFFRAWADHQRPELFVNPRPGVNVYLNTRETIKMLKRC